MKRTNIIRHTICIICTTIIFVDCHSQPRKQSEDNPTVTCSDCNLKDANGKKTGLWIENNRLREVYYKNGKRNGVYKVYNRKNGKLLVLGEYKEGAKSGIWYFFDESSHLLFTEENICLNDGYTRIRDDGAKITPKFTSYVKNYYSNGMLKEEGQVLYEEDIEINYYKTGAWKYYDKEGGLISTKKEG